MTRKITLPTRGIGSEPEIPEKIDVIRWIRGRIGQAGDLTGLLLTESFVPQVRAGISVPCAGGPFYAARIRDALVGCRGDVLVEEPGTDPALLSGDAADINRIKRGAWFTFPAPHALGVTDTYFSDSDEFSAALCRHVLTCTRALRDSGAGGFILSGVSADEEEIKALVRKDLLFWFPVPDEETLSLLLEVQRAVIIEASAFPMLLPLLEEYPTRSILLLDPDPQSVSTLLEFRDPDHIEICGFCKGDCLGYWDAVQSRSSFIL